MTTSVAQNMVTAASALIESFSADQREAACWPFPSNDERTLWFYTPTDHGGLPLAHMGSAQHRLTHQLIATALSTPGYVTLSNIIGRENLLDYAEGFTAGFTRDRGRDPTLYYVSIFGTPSMDTTWSWRFGGHHISLHFAVVAGEVIATTPCFFGADPASAPLLGPHFDRPLGSAEDYGRELVRSLSVTQLGTALISDVAPLDIVGANRTRISDGDKALTLPEVWRGRFDTKLDKALAEMHRTTEEQMGFTDEHLDALALTTRPKGVAAAALSTDQQEILRAVLGVYIGRLHDDLADAQVTKVNEAFDQLHFVWAGGTEPGQPHYYRIQGGDLLIEYDNTARDANHLHAVWRDMSQDFGGDPLAEHYMANHDVARHRH